MLSRKHYRKLAGILAESSTVDDVLYNICVYLEEDNPNFNKDLFIEASKSL